MSLLILSVLIPLLVAIWVASDAKKRGYPRGAIIGWFIGVWFLLIVFLPLYLILRSRQRPTPEESGALKVCPNCGRLLKGNPVFCPYCEERLR